MADALAPVPEIRNSQNDIAARVGGLQRAVDLSTQPRVAAGIGVSDRMLRHYLLLDRGMSPLTLIGAANALENHAAELTAHAAKLRELAR